MSKSSRTKYKAEKRDIKKKERNVLKSSHGKWTYTELKEHQKKIEDSRPKIVEFSKKKRKK